MFSQEKPWPSLREDLTIHAGPADPSGAPTWTLHDPARNQYFSLDWIAFEVISRIKMGNAAQITEAINDGTTLHVDEESIGVVLQFLEENELVQRNDFAGTSWLNAKNNAREKGIFQHLLHGYLFFRVPLFKPDKYLGKALGQLQFLYSPLFFKVTACAFLLGVWGVFRQWQLFSATLVDTFSWDGLIGYSAALLLIKILHELGHALTAKRFGCRVPTMGVAFLVMMPVAYTDVTESWKLNSHHKRLVIAGAGIMTEIILAAWALLAWTLMPDGALRGVCFFVATTSLVATFAVNASPFMRFDGYFLLCDAVGIPNLHARSFGYARWWLREKLFHLGDPKPEEFSPKYETFILLFAFITWVYRLVVFFGIALLVYHYFFKALGIILFGVELWYFLTRPIWNEFIVWKKRWSEIGPVVRHRPAYYVSLILLGLIVIPYDVTINTQGMLKPERSFSVIAFQAAQVLVLPPPIASNVKSGELIMKLDSPELDVKLLKARAKVQTLTKQFGAAGFSADTITQQPIFRDQLQSATEELKGLVAERGRLYATAPFTGSIVDVEPDLFVGEWVPKGMQLVTLIDDEHWVVDCYIDESDLHRIDLGNWGRFVPEAPGLGSVGLSVIAIDRDASKSLLDGSLASSAGGQVLVRQQGSKSIPERSIYRVRLKVDGSPGKISTGYLRGAVTIFAWPKSVLGDVLRGGLATFVREAGF
ncbi:site-2 protease family protein [Polynucleobacter sp. JS-JIR-II-50]|uniref:site-2 protease family protein n=1 Tax=Polynucleobacter sp. JS-JIR-II-50 TaxID=2576919 RepID=UPI001BFD9BF3|nr:site-2 protease family protein [Polynucleobacter sp. JS-JIR-II-50]QWE03737.1 HlyD family efflux transporter periplasmic adaptor subunit [Polynucleobacter sp. JS-JIR-II-50]